MIETTCKNEAYEVFGKGGDRLVKSPFYVERRERGGEVINGMVENGFDFEFAKGGRKVV